MERLYFFIIDGNYCVQIRTTSEKRAFELLLRDIDPYWETIKVTRY